MHHLPAIIFAIGAVFSFFWMLCANRREAKRLDDNLRKLNEQNERLKSVLNLK